jgi:hypothetical protein
MLGGRGSPGLSEGGPLVHPLCHEQDLAVPRLEYPHFPRSVGVPSCFDWQVERVLTRASLLSSSICKFLCVGGSVQVSFPNLGVSLKQIPDFAKLI